MGFSLSVNKDIERWVSSGLIDRATADRLGAELDSRPGRFGLGAVLGVFGAVLLGAALLSLVAANWQDIPRLARVALIVAVILAGYLGGAWRAQNGDGVFSASLYLIAAAAFGGGIALVGQMYHLSGDMASAALVWSLGVLAAGMLLLSGNLAAMAGLTGLFYLFSVVSEPSWHSLHYPWITTLLCAAVALTARATHSRLGLHAAAWLFLTLCAVIRVDNDADALDYAFAAGGSALFFVFAYFENAVERVTHFARALQFYALAGAFTGLAAIQLQLASQSVAATALLGIVMIALSVAALAVRGRDHGQVRSIAYLAFAAEVLYLAFVTVGSIIGTSLFFFLIGIFVIALAFLVVRLEKRFKTVQPGARP